MMSLFITISVIIIVGVISGISGILWLRQRNFFLAATHYNNGVSYLQTESYPEAVDEFKAALKRQNTMLEARYGLGLAYLKQDRYREGIEMLEEVVRGMPKNAIAYYNLGRAYINVGKLDEAQHALETALKINPDIKEIYFNLSKVFQEKGKLDQAKLCCRNALKLDGNYSKAKEYLDRLNEIRYRIPLDYDLIRKALQNFDQDDTEFMIKL